MAETLSLKKAAFGETAPAVVTWEYQVRSPNVSQPLIIELAPVGEAGWELCGIYQRAGAASPEFIYKRRKAS